MTISRPPVLSVDSARVLTSRECYQALEGLVGALVTSPQIGAARVKSVLELWLTSETPWLPVREQAGDGKRVGKTHVEIRSILETAAELRGTSFDMSDVVSRAISGSISGSICGLRTMASEEDVRAALEFILYTPSVWEGYRK